MRRTWQMACKELLQNRRDGLAALFTIILPVIFTIFLGLMIGGAVTETFPLAVADSDDSSASRALVERLRDSPLLRIEKSDLGKIDTAVKDQKAAAGLIIPEGFGVSLQGGGDSAVLTFVRVETSSGAQTVQQAVSTIVAQFNAALLASRAAAEQVAQAAGISNDAALLAQATTLAQAQLATPVITATLVDAGTLSEGTRAQGFDQSSTGGLVNWVLFGIIGVAGMTVWERKQGLLRRLNVAGVGASEIVGGKMIAMIIITMLQQLLLVIVGKFALGVDYFNSPLALFMIMISLSGLAASFGLFISVVFRSEQAVVATTVISALLLAAIGGAWFPLEVTSAGFSRFAHVLPSAWLMDALHGITLKGWGAGDVLLPLAVVWAWIVGVFGLAVWRYRPE
jgi:ABC-2 type transport system permease protein